MIIHQSLHGYDNGHNLLSSSILLSHEDEDRMKLLSDWSEYDGGVDGDTSYITAYPLNHSGLYVIAKSWYAEEMKRPGCVWTHSLILNLNDIDDDFNFLFLQQLFRRPVSNNWAYYSRAIDTSKIDFEKIENEDFGLIEEQWISILRTLFSDDKKLEFGINRNSKYYQSLCLYLIQYMPLTILEKLFVCSGTSYSRKVEDSLYSVQFLTNSRKFINTTSYSTTNNIGLRYMASCLAKRDIEASFLIRFYSKDISSVRIFYGVLSLLKCLDQVYYRKQSISYKEVLDFIMVLFPNNKDGSVTKRTFGRKKIGLLFTDEFGYYLQLCIHPFFSNVSPDLIDSHAIFKKIFSSSDRLDFLVNVSSSEHINRLGDKILKEYSLNLSINDQRFLAANNWKSFLILLGYNYNLLLNDYWLSLGKEKIELILPYFEKCDTSNFKFWNELLLSLLNDNVVLESSLQAKIAKEYPNSIILILDFLNGDEKRKLNHSFDNFSNSINKVSNWIGAQEHFTWNVIDYIIRTVKADDPVLSFTRSKDWYNLIDKGRGFKTFETNVFFFRLSFDWQDEYAIKILGKSFYKLHESIANNEVTDSQLSIISQYFDKLPFWQDWDKCKKLRKGIIKYLKSIGKSQDVLHSFTPSKRLNKLLKKEW